ncbi:MAG: hypothetical protein HY273_10405 [Gammaproteobacteria bacterium]|nr:hypothetical protein [Gammaproteobacteria bacterium]
MKWTMFQRTAARSFFQALAMIFTIVASCSSAHSAEHTGFYGGAWDARAVLIRQQVGRAQDLKPMWGAEAGLHVMQNVSLGLRWQHYVDVAGTDINAALVSIKYWF